MICRYSVEMTYDGQVALELRNNDWSCHLLITLFVQRLAFLFSCNARSTNLFFWSINCLISCHYSIIFPRVLARSKSYIF